MGLGLFFKGFGEGYVSRVRPGIGRTRVAISRESKNDYYTYKYLIYS